MKKAVRIGCASGFYGDSQLAARQLVNGGRLDYLVFDYLAEVTMAILSRVKEKNENLGYAVDFVPVAMRDVLKDCADKGIKVVANAGGVNVPACIAALEALCDEQNINLKIAGVYGDNLTDCNDLPLADMVEMQTGAPMPEKPISINAYLGARSIADALNAGADVVVTGRVVDSAVVIGPLMHEFGWAATDYDRIAQGALAGHVIECGAQCCGGNFTDWHLVPDFSDISYPIADVSDDGSFIVGIPPDTGGLVTPATVGEQILYEISDPANYRLPDVACDFSQVQLYTIGKDRVRVSGARGHAPGNQYKVCVTWQDGYRLLGTFHTTGPRAAAKAQTNLDAWVKRTRSYFKEKGIADYRQVNLEVIGAEHAYGPHAKTKSPREVVAKFGVHHDSKEALVFAAAELAYLGTSGTPAFHGIGAGRPRPQPLMRVHSTFIDKRRVPVTIQVGRTTIVEQTYETAESFNPAPRPKMTLDFTDVKGDWVTVPLETLAYARSGDKGNNANIGIIARKPEYLPILFEQLTAHAVKDYFAHMVEGEVERYEVPGFNAFNFFMTEALGGGGTGSVRTDAQGKAYGQILLSMPIKIPVTLLQSKRNESPTKDIL